MHPLPLRLRRALPRLRVANYLRRSLRPVKAPALRRRRHRLCNPPLCSPDRSIKNVEHVIRLCNSVELILLFIFSVRHCSIAQSSKIPFYVRHCLTTCVLLFRLLLVFQSNNESCGGVRVVGWSRVCGCRRLCRAISLATAKSVPRNITTPAIWLRRVFGMRKSFVRYPPPLHQLTHHFVLVHASVSRTRARASITASGATATRATPPWNAIGIQSTSTRTAQLHCCTLALTHLFADL